MNRNEAINAVWNAIPTARLGGRTPENSPDYLGNIDAILSAAFALDEGGTYWPITSDQAELAQIVTKAAQERYDAREGLRTNVPTCPPWCAEHDTRTAHTIENEYAGYFRVRHESHPDADASVTLEETATYDAPESFLPGPDGVEVYCGLLAAEQFLTRDVAHHLAAALAEAVRIIDEHDAKTPEDQR